jgi:hypothetical protein
LITSRRIVGNVARFQIVDVDGGHRIGLSIAYAIAEAGIVLFVLADADALRARDAGGEIKAMEGDGFVRRRLRAGKGRPSNDCEREQYRAADANHVADLPARWIRLISIARS